MVIRGEDRPRALLELLWVRDAYRLEVGADIPPLGIRPSGRTTDAATRAHWSDRWPEVWRAALLHATDVDTTAARAAIPATAPGSPERMALLRAAAGPSWSDEVGERASEREAYDAWTVSLGWPDHPRRLEDVPERIAVDALVPAWRAGLTTIVRLPVSGPLGRRAGRHGLLVSDLTRADPSAFRDALRAFAA